MRLTAEHVARLEKFMNRIQSETYPEIPRDLHSKLTHQMMERIFPCFTLPPGARVLDVGCGQGVALEEFKVRGFNAIGIALNPVDVDACRAKGFEVREMEQSFLDFGDGEFDMVWCRHFLEHSIFPYFTLAEFRRVLKPNGWLYVEVPAPDTASQHQANPNHYSVLGKSLWIELIRRSGYNLIQSVNIGLNVGTGPDMYWAFLQQRKP